MSLNKKRCAYLWITIKYYGNSFTKQNVQIARMGWTESRFRSACPSAARSRTSRGQVSTLCKFFLMYFQPVISFHVQMKYDEIRYCMNLYCMILYEIVGFWWFRARLMGVIWCDKDSMWYITIRTNPSIANSLEQDSASLITEGWRGWGQGRGASAFKCWRPLDAVLNVKSDRSTLFSNHVSSICSHFQFVSMWFCWDATMHWNIDLSSMKCNV